MEGDVNYLPVNSSDQNEPQQSGGCGDTGLDEIFSPSAMEWDSIGDGGYDFLCHEDILDDIHWLDVSELEPPLQLSYNVEILGSVDPRVNQVVERNYSPRAKSSVKEPYRIVFGDEVDDVYSSVSTEYLSCSSNESQDGSEGHGRDVDKHGNEAETKSIHLQFPNVHVNIDVTVSQRQNIVNAIPLTIDKVKSLPESEEKRWECEKWLKKHNDTSAFNDNTPNRKQKSYSRKDHGKICVKGPREFSFTSSSSLLSSFWKDSEMESIPENVSEKSTSSVSSELLDTLNFQSKVYTEYTLTNISPSSSLDDASSLQTEKIESSLATKNKNEDNNFGFDFEDIYIEDPYLPPAFDKLNTKILNKVGNPVIKSVVESAGERVEHSLRRTETELKVQKWDRKIDQNKSAFKFDIDFNMKKYMVSKSESDYQKQHGSTNYKETNEVERPWLKIYKSERYIIDGENSKSKHLSVRAFNESNNTSKHTEVANKDSSTSLESSLYSRFVSKLKNFYYGKNCKTQETGSAISKIDTQPPSRMSTDKQSVPVKNIHVMHNVKNSRLAVVKKFVKNVVMKSENEVLLEYLRNQYRIYEKYKYTEDNANFKEDSVTKKTTECSDNTITKETGVTKKTTECSDNTITKETGVRKKTTECYDNTITKETGVTKKTTECSDNTITKETGLNQENIISPDQHQKRKKRKKKKSSSFYSRLVDNLHLLYLGKISSDSESSTDDESKTLECESNTQSTETLNLSVNDVGSCGTQSNNTQIESNKDKFYYENQIPEDTIEINFECFGERSNVSANTTSSSENIEKENRNVCIGDSVHGVQSLINKFEHIIDDCSPDDKATPKISQNRTSVRPFQSGTRYEPSLDNVFQVSKAIANYTINKSENQILLEYWRLRNQKYGTTRNRRKDSKLGKTSKKSENKTVLSRNANLKKDEIQTVLRLSKNATDRARKELMLEFWRAWNRKYCRYRKSSTRCKAKYSKPSNASTDHGCVRTHTSGKATEYVSKDAYIKKYTNNKKSKIPIAKYSLDSRNQQIATKGISSWAVFQGGKEITFEYWRNWNKVHQFATNIPVRKFSKNKAILDLAVKRLVGFVVHQSIKETILEFWRQWNKNQRKAQGRFMGKSYSQETSKSKDKQPKRPVKRDSLSEKEESKLIQKEKMEDCKKTSSSPLVLNQIAKSLVRQSTDTATKLVTREFVKKQYSKRKQDHEKHVHFLSHGQQVEFSLNAPDSKTDININFGDSNEKIRIKKQYPITHYQKTLKSNVPASSKGRSRKAVEQKLLSERELPPVDTRPKGKLKCRKRVSGKPISKSKTAETENGKTEPNKEERKYFTANKRHNSDTDGPTVSMQIDKQCATTSHRKNPTVTLIPGQIPLLLQSCTTDSVNLELDGISNQNNSVNYRLHGVTCSLCRHANNS